MIGRPLTSTLFPYTTLFRSRAVERHVERRPVPTVHVGLAVGSRRGGRGRRVVLEGGRARGRVPRRVAARAAQGPGRRVGRERSEEHTSELQSRQYLVCRLLL